MVMHSFFSPHHWLSEEPHRYSCIFWLTHPGAASGSTDLLPAPSPSTNWTVSLLTDSGRDSDLIYIFDGHHAANVPDHVVPENLTDQFTIATWMKHEPSPGLRAEKETLLCNSDKTGEDIISRLHVNNDGSFTLNRPVILNAL